MNAFPNPPGRYAILGARRPRRGKSWRGLETSSRRALPFTHSFPGLPDAPGPRICRYSLYPGAKNTFETVQKSPAPSKLPAAVSSLDGAGPFHLLREITACRPAYAAQAGKILGKLLSKTGESLNGIHAHGAGIQAKDRQRAVTDKKRVCRQLIQIFQHLQEQDVFLHQNVMEDGVSRANFLLHIVSTPKESVQAL